MKKIILFMFALVSMTATAQKDVTKFLGIPVDGYKTEMKEHLISKGFIPKQLGEYEYLEGEFNGTEVHVYIATNNNKVYRVMLCDARCQDEANIKIRFNKLVNQFENNKRYNTYDNYTISDNEDISYEMTVKKKNYDALYYQKPEIDPADTLAIWNQVIQEKRDVYSEEEIQNPTPLLKEFIELAYLLKRQEALEAAYKKPVWFRICKNDYGEYYISMFYDNEYNRANGEDL